MTVVVAVLAAAVAAIGVRTTAHTDGGRRLWWLGGLLAGAASALTQAASPVPAAPGLAAGGIVAAALVDVVEGRVPTLLAHAATAVSLVALGAYAADRGEWGELLVGPVLFAALLVAGCTVLWLARAVGFGDVRLAAATVTAMVAGAEGLLLVVWGAFVVTGLAVVVLRLVGRGPKHLPFGPGLAVGWVVAILLG